MRTIVIFLILCGITHAQVVEFERAGIQSFRGAVVYKEGYVLVPSHAHISKYDRMFLNGEELEFDISSRSSKPEGIDVLRTKKMFKNLPSINRRKTLPNTETKAYILIDGKRYETEVVGYKLHERIKVLLIHTKNVKVGERNLAPGDSGSPLLDSNGNLIALLTGLEENTGYLAWVPVADESIVDKVIYEKLNQLLLEE